MQKSVRPAKARSTTRCTCASVCASQLAVGSSITTTRAWLSVARAIATSWRSPALNCSPPLPTSASSAACTPTCVSADFRASSPSLPLGSRLPRSVPRNRKGIWGTMATALRRVCSPTLEMSTPSSSTPPELISTSRSSITDSEDLPAPVRPTTPSLSPPATVMVRPLTAGGRCGMYRSVAPRNSTRPAVGHAPGAGSASPRRGASWGTSSDFSSSRRSRLAMNTRTSEAKKEAKARKYGITKEDVSASASTAAFPSPPPTVSPSAQKSRAVLKLTSTPTRFPTRRRNVMRLWLL
mmetsp:Transcript_50241/g.133372  ORF Transcript_50241/g.133372 Transcript_50241/m.133372 type:complete len:295 (+) Transcript_50241:273-1157(+)